MKPDDENIVQIFFNLYLLAWFWKKIFNLLKQVTKNKIKVHAPVGKLFIVSFFFCDDA